MALSMQIVAIVGYALLKAMHSSLQSDAHAARSCPSEEPAGPKPLAVPRPMYPTHVRSLPIGDEWSYEVKLRGRRALAIKHGSRTAVLSPGFELAAEVQRSIRLATARVNAGIAVLDGQLIPVTPWHRAWWPELARYSVVFGIFDLLRVNDDILLERPLAERRTALSALSLRGPVMQIRPVPATPDEVIALCKKIGFDAIAKRRDSPYEPGIRSDHWQLMKITPAQALTHTDVAAVDTPAASPRVTTARSHR